MVGGTDCSGVKGMGRGGKCFFFTSVSRVKILDRCFSVAFRNRFSAVVRIFSLLS